MTAGRERRGKIISFRHSADKLPLGKAVTRRKWSPSHASYMKKNWDKKLFPVYDKGPYEGGKQIGIIRITQKPYLEKLSDMPDADLSAEGFPNLSKQEYIDSFFQGISEQEVWVVRFIFHLHV